MTPEEIIQSVSDIPSYILDDDIRLYHKYVSNLPDHSLVLDIGTGLGKSAVALALSNPGVEVMTIDNGKYPVVRGWADSVFDYEVKMRDTFKSHNVDNISLFIDEAEEVFKEIDLSIDLFHLDGEKETEAGLLQLVYPKISFGGIILLRNHDRIEESKIINILNKIALVEQRGKIKVFRK